MIPLYSNDFQSISGKPLHLEITEFSRDSISVEVTNKSYRQERTARLRLIIILVLLFTTYASLIQRTIIVDGGFLLTLLYLISATFNLVKNEKATFLSEFGLQITTQRFLGRKSSRLISSLSIHDIAINENIQDLSIKYILIVRTKGSLYEEKPIIPIFTSLEPTVDCLEIIYNHFQSKLQVSE